MSYAAAAEVRYEKTKTKTKEHAQDISRAVFNSNQQLKQSMPGLMPSVTVCKQAV
jgi:hypothetical protein